MEKTLTDLKAAVVATMTFLGAFLGWKGIMALVWVAVMALDYLSGTAAACKEGKWSSGVARVGLWHKLGMILAVLVSALSDIALEVACQHIPIGLAWPGVILPLVLAWYILTELGSILENAVKLGAKVPKWLTKFLAAFEHLVDDAADKVVDTTPTTEGLKTCAETAVDQLQ
jgi:toxin secretion/phage lysis holin